MDEFLSMHGCETEVLVISLPFLPSADCGSFLLNKMLIKLGFEQFATPSIAVRRRTVSNLLVKAFHSHFHARLQYKADFHASAEFALFLVSYLNAQPISMAEANTATRFMCESKQGRQLTDRTRKMAAMRKEKKTYRQIAEFCVNEDKGEFVAARINNGENPSDVENLADIEFGADAIAKMTILVDKNLATHRRAHRRYLERRAFSENPHQFMMVFRIGETFLKVDSRDNDSRNKYKEGEIYMATQTITKADLETTIEEIWETDRTPKARGRECRKLSTGFRINAPKLFQMSKNGLLEPKRTIRTTMAMNK